ncbi:MAG: apolipoprotein N-acyltransferase, partial [Gammaproteobacteria bacterium]|nr:apolipoprotein N-acyltransferase [Gammaproteobacteria bacterium]
PAILFFFWSEATPARSAWLGFLFGLGLFGAGASWVYVSIHEFGFMPAPLAAFLVFLFVAVLSIFPAIAGGMQARIAKPGIVRLLFAIPVFWVLMEWLRGWLLTGFPWLHLGYSQSNSLLMNLAPLLGVYGISLMVAILAAIAVSMIRNRDKTHLLLTGGLAAAIFSISWMAAGLQFVEPAGKKVDIALLQGNIPLSEKWKPGASHQIISHYVALSRRVANDADIVVWPEGAVPDSWQHVSPWLGLSLPRRQDGSAPDYLIGTIDSEPAGRYYNVAITIAAAKKNPGTAGIYRKQHLVPFGEFLPFKPLLGWLIEYLKIPMSDFSSWQGAQPDISLAGWPVAISICYEDAFGEELAENMNDAAFLINISEDAWFGDSLAPHQRLQMAQLRAREMGRYFVRAANTGVTAVINEKGEVTASLEQFISAALVTEVVPMQGMTPYVRYGNSLLLGLLFLWFLPVLFVWIKK